MKIELNKTKPVLLSEVKHGECFFFKDLLYQRVNASSYFVCKECSKILRFPSTRLGDGEVYNFHNMEVIPANVKVVSGD